MGQDKDRERSVSNFHPGQKRADLGKMNLTYYQTN